MTNPANLYAAVIGFNSFGTRGGLDGLATGLRSCQLGAVTVAQLDELTALIDSWHDGPTSAYEREAQLVTLFASWGQR